MANETNLLIAINSINYYYFDKCNNEYGSGLLTGGLFIQKEIKQYLKFGM